MATPGWKKGRVTLDKPRGSLTLLLSILQPPYKSTLRLTYYPCEVLGVEIASAYLVTRRVQEAKASCIGASSRMNKYGGCRCRNFSNETAAATLRTAMVKW